MVTAKAVKVSAEAIQSIERYAIEIFSKVEIIEYQQRIEFSK